ncbi:MULTISPECIES: TspO/MBR family protein [unclassified Cellulophaga]|uniref:TspO/MBR family protein n=1 Tax=unclassified Cellulophaga TaxID=2634405 RepID=UPI0026E490C7|nr:MULTISPECIES: TspO/MBR family protein [unclassified Cellulophaga]MDO6490906.1 TspO/MBR family protein [Cellulophaga sp. 2_MG-2023]MDO6493900.1 TspO/MBR family protein [Cellulophaga sp. 3_MG-2023]
MKLAKYIILFLVLNFGALALGVLLMDNGAQSNWYLQLNKAPWTPPGWVFGAAWTIIMVCFSIYLGILAKLSKNFKFIFLFVIQWFLNVGWNFAFFNQHNISIGLVIITALTFLILYIPTKYKNILKYKSLLLLPYIIWLFIATSLNAYILIYN